ncbi:hypothetical protein SAMN02982929_04675 [Saccharopolyspora kobensis]|uniref:Uncharacterized protein n=1 Tax=Saccharopolyspora kobensis TaxID=146035 RepID=A0A1H6DN79_9PSEU|nr:hypothetical protein SAMN02982929_04675 [Saccharopolyspora kobensis]SFF00682.1 hypothetical protein SAMN05216506_11785 [Saccharopolyspora kobensis]
MVHEEQGAVLLRPRSRDVNPRVLERGQGELRQQCDPSPAATNAWVTT